MGPPPWPSPSSDLVTLSRTLEHAAEFDGRLGPGQPDGVVVFQDRTAAVGRCEFDLAVGEDGRRYGDGLSVGGDLDVAIHGELELRRSRPWR